MMRWSSRWMRSSRCSRDRARLRPCQPNNRPNRCEHEYKRAGALNLFAASDTQSGPVYGQC